MDDLAYLRDRIKSYADYTNRDGRYLVDQQIRAYVGEATARLREVDRLLDDRFGTIVPSPSS